MYNSRKLLGREIGKITYEPNPEILAARPSYTPMGYFDSGINNNDRLSYIERTSKLHNTIGTYNPFADHTIQVLVPWGYDFEADPNTKTPPRQSDNVRNLAPATPATSAITNRPFYSSSKVSF